MVQKRQSRDQEGDGGDFTIPHRQRAKKKTPFKTVFDELTKPHSFNEALWEPFLRRVVREEVERAVSSCLNSTSSHSAYSPAGTSGGVGGSGLQLQFIGQIASTIYTGSRIEALDPKMSLCVILVDTDAQTIVTEGPLSSIKVELVALNGEFGSDEQEEWTQKQFEDSVQRPREGRRPLVTGELTVTLIDGVGVIGNLTFTDNSSWTRSRKFRLGARKISGGKRIREARSGAFTVKDHRGELYKKHHPPAQADEVWRLEKIAKDGKSHERLSSHGINTVQDFVCMYMRNPLGLREIVGIKESVWKVVVKHAMRCVVDDNKLYAYHSEKNPNVIVYFNSLNMVVKACFNNHILSPEEFNPHERSLVETLKNHALNTENALVLLDGLSFTGPELPLADPPLNIPTEHHQHNGFQVAHDQTVVPFGFNQAMSSSPAQVIHPLVSHKNSFSWEDLLTTRSCHGEPSWAGNGSQAPIITTNHLTPEYLLNNFQSSFGSQWSDQGTDFFVTTASNSEAGEAGIFINMSRFGRGRARWGKLRSAFKLLAVGHRHGQRMSNQPVYLGY